MKKLIYAATVMLSCLSSVSVVLTGAAAFAAQGSCPSVSGTTITGGSVQAELAMIAQCESSRPAAMSGATMTLSPNQTSGSSPTYIKKAGSPGNDSYPAYCPSLPQGLQADSFVVREALQRCLFGS
jgi:hypothetical protein